MSSHITVQETRVALLDSERRVLERIASGAPLREILETLVRLIEEQADGMRCAVLLVDTMQRRLRFAAAPNIPEDYKTGIDSFLHIASNMASCGTAAFLRKPVYTKDTGVDALWEDCRDIAVRNGLRAIWSTPILSDDNAVLGTFAMYYNEPRLPSTDHIHLIDMATQMVRVAVEAKSSEELLRTVFEGAPCGMEITDLAGNIVRVNPTFARLVGHTQAELQGKTIVDVTHEEDYPQNKALIDELLAGKREAFVIDKRYRRKDGQLVWVHNTVALLHGPTDEPRYMLALIEDITARKRAEEASLQMAGEIQALSRQKEDHLRLVIDTIPTMAWSVLPDGAVDFVNQRWLEYTGLSLEEALEGSTRTVHPEDLPSVMGKWSVDMAAGEPCEYEMRLRRADGKYRWFLVRTVPLRDELGNIVKWYGSSTDIEDRKQSERALKESEERCRLALDVAAIGTWRHDFETEIVHLDARSQIIWGFAHPDVKPADMIARISPEEREQLQNRFDSAGAEAFSSEAQLILPDGEQRWISLRGRRFFKGEGATREVALSIGTYHDITRLKKSERALQQREANQAARTRELQLVIDAIPQQIWSGPPDGTLDFCNARWRSELGLTLEELQGEGWQRMLHPDDRERVLLAWRESVTHGTPYEQQERHMMADGHYRRFLCRGVPFRDEGGRILRWYGTNTDVEEAKRADEALQRSQAYLAEAQRLSGTGSFGWNISNGTIFWSTETFRIFQCEPDIQPTLELVIRRTHPEDVGLVQEVINRALIDRKDWGIEHRLLMPNGSAKYVRVVAHVMTNSAGELEYVGAVMDITQTKLAFQEIQALKDQLYKENLALKEEVDQASMFEEIVGSSDALNRVLRHAARVAPTDSTVLIKGETGTGKELIARAIHKRSPRSARAFVRVNCAAIPASLIASELFGHEKGAFTGATQRRLGRFELADGGTIFLDEVGELPADTQLALLRVLQEREFERVGGSQLVSVNVRVLAATNRDLQAAVDAGTFRMDLFYRLHVFPIQIPSLRERVGDIPMLVEYFIGRYAGKLGKRIRNIEKRTLELLQTYHWPGNIRELQNVVERAVVLRDSETFSIDETWLQHESPTRPEQFLPLAASLVDREREMIESALAESRGRVSGPTGAAGKLGIPRSTLESKIRSLRINKHRFKS